MSSAESGSYGSLLACAANNRKSLSEIYLPPVADHPDVVVQFDDSPVRVVFWRGLRYSPAWVTENGLWLADQSGESGNEEGCIEHMLDPHCRFSHVRIIESSPANHSKMAVTSACIELSSSRRPRRTSR